MDEKRIADKEIYNDSAYHDQPKEYFKFIASKIDFLLKENEMSSYSQIIDVSCANGALLSYLKKVFPKTKMIGYEPVKSLIELGEKLDSSIEFHQNTLYDIPKLNEVDKAEVVIAAGVIGIFEDPQIFLLHLLSLTKKGGTVLILSPFNEEPIDVILKYKYAKNDFWEIGHNLFSLETMKNLALKNDLTFEVDNFEMPFKIEKTDDPMRSWTESFRNNSNTLVYGTNMFSTIKVLTFKKST